MVVKIFNDLIIILSVLATCTVNYFQLLNQSVSFLYSLKVSVDISLFEKLC